MSSPTIKNTKKSKNISTKGTGENTALLSINNNAEPANGNNINSKSSKKNMQKSINNSNGEKMNIESNIKELREKIAKLKNDIGQERNLSMKETSKLNEDITEKLSIINYLTQENKNLLSNLKNMKLTLDGKMEKGKSFLLNMEKLKDKEKKIKSDIKIIEDEIKNEKKNAKIVKKDYKRAKNVLDDNDEQKEKMLKEELEQLQKNKLILETEILDLRKIISKHKICSKKKSYLTSELNLATNAYQFEIKKKNMIDSNESKLEEKKEIVKIAKKEEKNIINNSRSISYSKKIARKVLVKMKKKKSENPSITSRATNYISNICNNMGNKYKNKSGNIKDINNSDYEIKPKVLFTENEKLQLASIIPPIYLNKFRERFEEVENQRYELADKLKTSLDNHNNNKKKEKIKLNYTELKKKEIALLAVDLNSNLAKKNALASKIMLEIQKLTREFNNWNKLLKIKTNENLRIQKYLNELINNKEKKKHKNEKVEQSEEINNKKSINSKKNIKTKLQKQTNITFGYNMKK